MIGRQKIWGRVRTEIVDAVSGRTVKASGWTPNLILDVGLVALANGTGYANIFQGCKIGSSNAPNQIASGAVTFTQVGTAITASGSFFSSGMTGALFKYGTGTSGAEQYITFVDATHATSSVSSTVALPTLATVWMVQATTLTSYLFVSSTYSTSSGDCGFAIVTNTITQQRKFIFAQQASPYTVNEIGYSSNGSNSSDVLGRVVLGSSDTISPSQFYKVTVEITATVSPGVPAPAGNVGTGIDTTGTVGLQVWDCQAVQANGTSGNFQAFFSSSIIDACQGVHVGLVASAITLPSGIINGGNGPQNTIYQLGTLSISQNGAKGQGVGTCTFSITTAGESCAGFILGAEIDSGRMTAIFVLNLTTPITLPTGTFSGTFSFQNQFVRTLSN